MLENHFGMIEKRQEIVMTLPKIVRSFTRGHSVASLRIFTCVWLVFILQVLSCTEDETNTSSLVLTPEKTVEKICDGTPDIRFFGAALIGGEVDPYTTLLWENGIHYILLDGNCKFYVYKQRNRRLYSGILSHEQAVDFVSTFRLNEWKQWVGNYCFVAVDAGGDYWNFMGETILVSSSNCTQDNHDEVEWLSEATRGQIEYLKGIGEVWSGDMRYVLYHEQHENPYELNEYNNAPLWPLSSIPSEIAHDEPNDFLKGEGEIATGDDSVVLHQLLESNLKGEIGVSIDNLDTFIGVRDDTGAFYKLYLRDANPYENKTGLLSCLP